MPITCQLFPKSWAAENLTCSYQSANSPFLVSARFVGMSLNWMQTAVALARLEVGALWKIRKSSGTGFKNVCSSQRRIYWASGAVIATHYDYERWWYGCQCATVLSPAVTCFYLIKRVWMTERRLTLPAPLYYLSLLSIFAQIIWAGKLRQDF